MKALISPNENNRICQVESQDFPVAEPLFWATCPADCTTRWTYVDGQFSEPVAPEVVVPPAPTKAELLAKLQEIQAQITAL